jgi:hypothetical protein
MKKGTANMNDNRLSTLDRALQAGGAERLRSGFAELAASDRQRALLLLDDEKLRFPALFTVLPEIRDFKLTGALSPRNAAAANLCMRKLKRLVPAAPEADFGDSETLYQALRWMFDTGKGWEAGPMDRNDFEAVFDYVSALLVITFEDTSVLPDIARLIFRRRRQGRLIHDLVWCFFQTLNHDALSWTADQLLSQDAGDAALAVKLLDLELPAQAGRIEIRALHRKTKEWLSDNRPFLYVTGEHFQQSSKPKHLDVDREAKYLGKELSPRYRAPVAPMNERELKCLHEYRGFSQEERELLTEYSHRLRRDDARAWEAWMSKQVAEQVLAARSGVEAV